MTRHIRKSRKNVTDHRHHFAVKYENKRTPTLCGAEPDRGDISRTTGEHFIASESLRPDWLEDVCPECLRRLRGKIETTTNGIRK